MKKLLQSLLVLTLTIGLSSYAYAQTDSDQITATATVEASVDVQSVQGLDFGTLSAGGSSDIATTDAGAGQFTVKGNSGSVDLSFSFGNGGELVAQDNGDGNDGANIPITFDDSDAAYGPDASTQDDTWNPESETATVDVAADSDQTIYVFIGGSISAPAGQVAGTYTETITLTATHN